MERQMDHPVSYQDLTVTGGFWKDKQDLFRKTTVDAVYDRFEETGRFEALKFNWKEGMPNQPHIFWESDVTKWIEGASYFLKHQRDAGLEAKVDELVERMKRTQGEDGYLNAYFTVVEPEARFTRRTDHELYCAGHLVEGAIAYAEATGKTDMLEVAKKYIDLIDRVFRIEHSAKFDTPGHEEIELALFRLYEYTGEERYKLLAEYFINTRGTSERDATYDFTDQEHMQSHVPVRKQRTAEGHSVRALYLYSGMADMARIEQEEELTEICKTLYENITRKRMYITGGVGSTHRGESFSFDYDLPEYTAYNETCASIALAMFCRRMWLLEKDGKYADCAERAIYNTVLSGVSLSGNEFYYENPLSADPARSRFNDSRPEGLKEHLAILERVKVFGCSCCPPNLLRIVGAIADYMYSVSDNTIYAHCYMDAAGKVELNGKTVGLTQKTNYPYDGVIGITTDTDGEYTIALRIPAWAGSAEITVNGEKAEYHTVTGYAYVTRQWKAGDEVVLTLPMQVKVFESNPRVRDMSGRAAVMRGPLVFCAEGIDNADRPMRDIRISRENAFTEDSAVISGTEVPVLKTKALIRKDTEELYLEAPLEEEEFELTLIPYFARMNRGVTELTTWLLLK